MNGFSTQTARLVASLVCLIAASSASAQSYQETAAQSPFSLAAGFGFTADPGSFLLSVEGPLEIGRRLSLVPLLQIGVDDDRTIVSPSLSLRYTLPLTDFVQSRNRTLRRISAHAQAGLGATHIDRDVGPFDVDDTGFLVNFGLGAEYRFDNAYSATTGVLFNFLPGDVLGESFYFSWQLIGFRRYF